MVHLTCQNIKTNAEGFAMCPDFYQELPQEDRETCSQGSTQELLSLKKPDNSNLVMLAVTKFEGLFCVTSRLRVQPFDLYHEKAVFFQSTD